MPLSDNAKQLQHIAQANFADEFDFQLSRHFKSLPCTLVLSILKKQCYSQLPAAPLKLVQQFALQERPLELVEHLLNKFLLGCLSQSHKMNPELTQIESQALVLHILQGHSVQSTCEKVKLTGKKQLRETLANGLQKLIRKSESLVE